jgi:hypothetical protein
MTRYPKIQMNTMIEISVHLRVLKPSSLLLAKAAPPQ